MAIETKRTEHPVRPQALRTEAVGFVEPEAISRRAYEPFQERGREPGRELDDWLRAEHELRESNSPGRSE
jgi:hypothetical protein